MPSTRPGTDRRQGEIPRREVCIRICSGRQMLLLSAALKRLAKLCLPGWLSGLLRLDTDVFKDLWKLI